jgi:hypothetical protein
MGQKVLGAVFSSRQGWLEAGLGAACLDQIQIHVLLLVLFFHKIKLDSGLRTH